MEFTSRRVQIQMKKLTEIHKLNTGDTKQASGMYLLFIRLLYSLLTCAHWSLWLDIFDIDVLIFYTHTWVLSFLRIEFFFVFYTRWWRQKMKLITLLFLYEYECNFYLILFYTKKYVVAGPGMHSSHSQFLYQTRYFCSNEWRPFRSRPITVATLCFWYDSFSSVFYSNSS